MPKSTEVSYYYISLTSKKVPLRITSIVSSSPFDTCLRLDTPSKKHLVMTKKRQQQSSSLKLSDVSSLFC